MLIAESLLAKHRCLPDYVLAAALDVVRALPALPRVRIDVDLQEAREVFGEESHRYGARGHTREVERVIG